MNYRQICRDAICTKVRWLHHCCPSLSDDQILQLINRGFYPENRRRTGAFYRQWLDAIKWARPQMSQMRGRVH